MAGFAALRPLGVGLDDQHYSMVHYFKACPTLECGQWFQQGAGRDQLWYSLIGLLKSIEPDPRVMLWLAGLGLAVKLWIMDRLCVNRSLALLFYAGCFYIIHDITALRVSLAISIYLLGFYFLVSGRFWWASGILAANGLFHKQAFLAPLELAGRWMKVSPRQVNIGLLLPLVLLMLKFYPNDSLLQVIMSQTWGKSVLHHLMGGDIDYLGQKLKGVYDHVRLVPVVVPPTLFLAAWLLPDLEKSWRELFQYVGASLLIAAWLLWGYAIVPDVQLRFWHFFLVPIVFLVGNVELSRWRLAIILLMALGYCLKYSAVNDLLLDPKSLLIENSLGGKVFSSPGFPEGPGYPCGKDCGVRYPEGTKVGVSEKADFGYRFDHWLGGCAEQKGNCYVIMDSDKRVSAAFAPVESLRMEVHGRGLIHVKYGPKGLLCMPTCNPWLDPGTAVDLYARPANAERWKAWSGSCDGQPNPCHLIMDRAHEVGAWFIDVHKVTVIPADGGSVALDAEDPQSCPGVCEKTVDAGTRVHLTAQPKAGYRFDRWTLGCSAKLPYCEITVESSIEVSARFVPVTDGGAD